jgi:hypothetical protein
MNLILSVGGAGGGGGGGGGGAGAGGGAGGGVGVGNPSFGSGSVFFPLRGALPIVILIFFKASFNIALFFDLAVCFEPVYIGCCIGCISGAGWTGSYLGFVVGIIGGGGGPGFFPPLFPLGESILYSAGCFVFLSICSTSIFTKPAAPGGGGGPPPPPVPIVISAICSATVGVACGLFSCTSLCLASATILRCSSRNSKLSKVIGEYP